MHCLIKRGLALFLFGSSLLLTGAAQGRDQTQVAGAVEAKQGMVVAVAPLAADAGVQMLRDGGNAVDAAVATAFAEAVTWPAAGNIGGGGFMVIYPRNEEPIVVDYREKAPLAATPTMLEKRDANFAYKTVGVPGTVAGLTLAHQKFGKLRWKHVLAPAVKLAQEGFPIDRALAGSLNSAVRQAPAGSELRRVYGKLGGKEQWQAGDTLLLPDLASSLHQIADQGPYAFYKGPIAEKIIAEMQIGGGLIIKQDLAGYKAELRKPIHGTYRGFDIYAPPPSSSGGICLIEMLNILETFDLKKHDRFSPETLHLMVEAMRRAYRDRARYLGDSEFVKIPSELTSKEYARELAAGISLDKATPSEALAKDIPLAGEGTNTTHFSVIDRDGMAVSNTYTLENSFGSRIVVRGAGFLLNNEMTDFNTKPGVTDRKGSIGTDANLIAPGKRMLSAQTPVIVSRNGKVFLVTGSPGSRTIINTDLCILVNVLDYGMDVRSAVDAPRIHHQWFPDVVHFEDAAKHPEAVAALRKLGHHVTSTRQGDAHSIWVDPKTGLYYGAQDKRVDGKAAGY
ncbi:MAG TPA: gamma-glutamyltransferase [Gemmataceae bacterium]|jgi:gamma-glutamyltranspeptidase/glutathione hydrolase|nr:gamma-glutamyltransferase [Gemmataceae bacterium]